MAKAFGKVAAAAAAVSALLLGCVADGTPSTSSNSGGYASPAPSSSADETTAPILVDVDTNGTLIATPGQGIGVYVEYAAGGQWTVSWTCDTSVTNLSCAFAVDASVTTGVIQNVAGIVPSSTDSLSESSSQQSVDALTTTTTGTDEITFDTTPGAVLTLAVTLNAPVSFFFVQDSMVNGGYTGALTNPLMFKPTTP